jgi:hypothetical protein
MTLCDMNNHRFANIMAENALEEGQFPASGVFRRPQLTECTAKREVARAGCVSDDDKTLRNVCISIQQQKEMT